MAINQFETIKKQLRTASTIGLKALSLSILGAVIIGGLGLPILAVEASPTTTPEAKPNNGWKYNQSQIKELAGKVLLDSQTEVTQSLQLDKYINFVNVSTPTLTPASGHSLLFANKSANQFIAKFSDGSTTILGSGSGGGAGTITGVTAGTDLTGGGTTGTVTLNVDNTLVLETSSATATYLQKSSATATYLQQSSATATYLQLSSATATYLQNSSATATYQVKGSYLTGNQNITLSGDSTGSGTTAITVSNAANQPNIVTFTSSITVSGPLGLRTTYGASLGSVTLRNVTSGTQCLHADSSGNVTGSGSDCAASASAKYFQLVSSANVITTNTTSNSFVTSNMAVVITPTSASNRVKISFHTVVIPNNCQMCVTLKRGVTELSGASCGFAQAGTNQTTGHSQQPLSFEYVDSPATTSATTYTVYFLNNSNGNTVTIGDASMVSTLIAEEIL